MNDTRKYAVHTPTKKDAEELMELYEKVGWSSILSHEDFVGQWNFNKEETCYSFENNFRYSDREFYRGERNFDQVYIEGETFTIITISEAKQKLIEMFPDKFPEEIKQAPTNKGFDANKMTFNGVQIEAGDKIQVAERDEWVKVFFTGELTVSIGDIDTGMYYANISLKLLNITGHKPKKTANQKAHEEVTEITSKIRSRIIESSEPYENTDELINDLEDYHFARSKQDKLSK